jgi:hypothetical protein
MLAALAIKHADGRTWQFLCVGVFFIWSVKEKMKLGQY